MDIFFSINTPLNPLSRGETVLFPPREGRRGGSKQSQNHAQKRLKLTAKRVDGNSQLAIPSIELTKTNHVNFDKMEMRNSYSPMVKLLNISL